MIAGVLFDSGGVLIRPIGGRWNPRHDFEGIVRSHHPAVTSFAAAIEAGSRLVGLPPGDCLFVDDDPDLVAAAVGLGYRGFALDRTTATLDDVLPIVAASP